MRGVDWKGLGIGEVYCAYNSFEAKKVFEENHVDIMLCDIEMPVENGLELLRWARSEGYDAECIFLTAHAEFDYAKAALLLGSLDYVVQPAPYDEIKAVVLRAIKKVSERQEEKRTYDFGKYMKDQGDLISARSLEDWLKKNIERDRYEDFAKVAPMPSLDRRGYLVLMQLIRQMIPIDQWEPSLMRFTFGNVLGEIFAPYGQRVMLCDMDKTIYGLVIYGPDGYDMDYPGLLRQLETSRQSFSRFIKCEAAFYADEACTVEQMPKLLPVLLNACRENVSMRSSVFDLNAQKTTERINENYMLMQMHRWHDFIIQGLGDTVREDACAYLDRMDAQGRLNRSALMDFHVELCRMLYSVGEELGFNVREVMEDPKASRLYTKAPQSLDDMKAFITRIPEFFIVCENDEYNQRNQVLEIERYIHDHIESDIHRDDIAGHVHLNVDYMGRLFKKARGVSLKEYIIEEKMRVARRLLKTTMLPVSFVASKVGYSNFSHFSRSYKKVHGISPTEERRSEKE